MGPRHPLPFLPMAHPMALKRPAWGWSSSFHQRCRRIFCSSCWKRLTPALQSLSWQLCIPRTAKFGVRVEDMGDGAWVLCVHFQVESPKYLKFHGSLHLMHQSSLSIADIFSLKLLYLDPLDTQPRNSETPPCQVRGKVWKEVVVFRDLRAVQIFKIDSYGHQHYRRNGRVRC